MVSDWWNWAYFRANLRKFDPCLYQFLHWIWGHGYTRRLILRPISAACPRIDLCTKNPPGVCMVHCMLGPRKLVLVFLKRGQVPSQMITCYSKTTKMVTLRHLGDLLTSFEVCHVYDVIWDVCTYFCIYGKRGPTAILWYQMGVYFSSSQGSSNDPISKWHYRRWPRKTRLDGNRVFFDPLCTGNYKASTAVAIFRVMGRSRHSNMCA